MKKVNTLLFAVCILNFSQQIWTASSPKNEVGGQVSSPNELKPFFAKEYIVTSNATLHPPKIKLLDNTNSSLTIKVIPHEADNATIESYTLYYKPVSGAWQTIPIDGKAENYTIGELSCGTYYKVYVIAWNRLGNGTKSDTQSFKTKGEKPIIPSAEEFIEVSWRQAVLNFAAWSDGGCPPLSYYSVEKKSRVWLEVANKVTKGKLVLAELGRGFWYHFRVTAHNSAGASVAEYKFLTLYNDTSPDDTAADIASSHPPIIRLIDKTNISVTLELTPHEDDNNTIHSYTIYYKEDSEYWQHIRVGGKAENYTIGELSCSRHYEVYAENGFGSGIKSNTVSFKTNGGKPVISPPNQFIKQSPTQTILDFDTWLDGGCRITFFRVEQKKRSSSKWRHIISVVDIKKLALPDLQPGQWYNLRIKAHSMAGFTVAEYEFATYNNTIGFDNTLRIGDVEDMSQIIDVR